MKANIESVLAAVRRAEYQSHFSIQKLLYLNSLTRSLVLRSCRDQPKVEEEVVQAVEHRGLLNRFALNGVNLTHLCGLPEEEKRAGYEAVRQSLMELITIILQPSENQPAPEEGSLISTNLWA